MQNSPIPVFNPIQAFFMKANSRQKRQYMAEYEKERKTFPTVMEPLPIPPDILQECRVLGVWRSREYMATAWAEQNPAIACRLSVNRTRIDPITGGFLGGILWDDLFTVKNQCGFADMDAIEVYPAADKLVNVANMRHLFVMEKRLGFGL